MEVTVDRKKKVKEQIMEIKKHKRNQRSDRLRCHWFWERKGGGDGGAHIPGTPSRCFFLDHGHPKIPKIPNDDDSMGFDDESTIRRSRNCRISNF